MHHFNKLPLLLACLLHNQTAFSEMPVYSDKQKSTTIAKSSSSGRWTSKSTSDPLTDKTVLTASILASQGSGRYGPISLTIRCKEGETEAYIDWSTFLAVEYIDVTSRFDKDLTDSSRWYISTDHKAAFMSDPVPKMLKLLGGKTFIAKTTPYSENPITAIFDITGATKALSKIRLACEWDRKFNVIRNEQELNIAEANRIKTEKFLEFNDKSCQEIIDEAKKYPNSDFSNIVASYFSGTPQCKR